MSVEEMKQASQSRCPSCGHELNTAAAFSGSDDAGPEPGDRTVCLECGHVMKFDESLRPVELTVDETIEAAQNPEIQQMLRAIRRAKR